MFLRATIVAVVALLTTAFSFCLGQLPEKQRAVADRYAQLEQIILRMSEVSATTNPKRAALLKKVLTLSKDRLVSPRLDDLARTLDQKRLTAALDGQDTIEKDLLELLKLLESENRDQRRDAEKERIKQFLRDLEELIHKEKVLKQRTAQNENTPPLEKDQKEVRDRTDTLREQIENYENPDKKPEPKKSDPDVEKKDSEAKKPDADSEKKDSEAKKPDADSEKKDSETKKPDADLEKKNSETKKSDADSEKKDFETKKPDADSEKNDAESDEGKSPTMKAMNQAVKRMKQAEEKLKNSAKNDAIKDQEEAIAELQKAKAELEKILRQIREEELMQTLEKLEARFKRMLRVEQGIRSQTEKLSKEPADSDDAKRTIQIQGSRLAADQQTVLDDADAALVLLREDGTAQAMAESLLQTRFDMVDIKGRLEKTDLGAVTISVEDSVIAALEEMLDAIELAIKEAKNRKEQQQQGGGGGGKEIEPLIQMLSELKMIRSMQRRVNDRTERYEKMIAEPNADLQVLQKAVEELARQQNRISRILHDIKVGRNE